jgi:HEAT repeat protein
VWALGAIGDPTAASVLVDSLHDVDVDVAATAARVVAELSPDQLVELDCCPTALEYAGAALSMLQLDGSLR